MQLFLAVFIGGGLGSVCRYILSSLITSNFTEINPVSTLVSNLISTIILGIVLFVEGSRLEISGSMKALLITGFCGGFSTFSTFSYETFELFRAGSYTFAIANILLSLVLVIGVLFLLSRNL